MPLCLVRVRSAGVVYELLDLLPGSKAGGDALRLLENCTARVSSDPSLCIACSRTT